MVSFFLKRVSARPTIIRTVFDLHERGLGGSRGDVFKEHWLCVEEMLSLFTNRYLLRGGFGYPPFWNLDGACVNPVLLRYCMLIIFSCNL